MKFGGKWLISVVKPSLENPVSVIQTELETFKKIARELSLAAISVLSRSLAFCKYFHIFKIRFNPLVQGNGLGVACN